MHKSQNYDDVARQFQAYVKEAFTEWTLGYPAVKALLEPLAEKYILDYGCGPGIFAHYLAECGAVVVGVDVAPEMLALAKAQASSASFCLLAEEGLNVLSPRQFDAAVLNFVLCTMPTQAQIVSTLLALRQVLIPGGLCIALNTNWERCNGANFVSFKLDRITPLKSGTKISLTLKSEPPTKIEDYFWSQSDYVSLFEQAGFTGVHVKEIRPKHEDQRWLDEKSTSPFFLTIGKKEP